MLPLISFMVFVSLIMLVLAVRRFWEGRTGKLERLFAGEQNIKPAKARPPFIEGLEKSLTKGGISMPGHSFLGMATVVVGAFFTLAIFFTGSLFAGYMGAAAGAVVLKIILLQQKNKRLSQFENQIDTVVNLLAGSLRAGASLAQAVSNVGDDVGEPAAAEFRTINRAIKLGVPAAEALEQAAARVGSQDLQMIATAALVQRETGGNLAEILDNNADTVRERRSLRSSLKALTSQGRISGIVIGVIPFIVTGIIVLISPGYFNPMLESAAGKLTLIGSFITIFIGWYFIRKITSQLDF